MAASVNDNNRPGPTPVPPRGGKRKPNRPTAKRPSGAPAGARPGAAGSPAATGRPVDNRRAALAQKRRRNQTLLAAGGIVVIVAVVAVLIAINASGGGGTKTNTATAPVAASTLDNYAGSVSVTQMKAAATNFGLTAVSGEGSSPYPKVIAGTPITTTGKPEILYIGAEYCPFCATERWPLVLALSKFGTFHNLTAVHSAGGSEVYPDTPTFSFYKSTYTSPYLTFTPVETETVTHAPLQSPTAAQNAIVKKYDTANTIPFVYFNGKAIISGAEFDPGLLGSGQNGPASKLTFQQIASSIAGGQTALSSNVLADAGVIVSDICHMTGGKPGNVCSLFPTPITR